MRKFYQSIFLTLIIFAISCSNESSENNVANDAKPTLKTPPNINVGAEFEKMEKLRWTTPYPSTCVRDPERRGRIIRARKLTPNPGSIDFMGLKLPERARIIDACEVELERNAKSRTVQQRYTVFSDEWPGPVAYFMSLGLERGLYFQDFDQCDFACAPRGPIPRGVSHYRQGEMQPNCWRTDVSLDIEQPKPDSLLGEIVMYKFIRLHRDSGIIDDNGCSG